MKHRFPILPLALLVALNLSNPAGAQGPSFTYQGRLTDGAGPAHGGYDLTFALFNSSNGVGQVGLTLTNPAVTVSNSLFAVALDFGTAAFNGTAYWLEIGVRPAGGGAFTTLSPRQPLAPSPYALFAPTAGTVPSGAIDSGKLADGAVTASKLAPGAVWQLSSPDGSPAGAVQVNADGLVGIGTSSPLAPLHVVGDVRVERAGQILLQADRVAMGFQTSAGGMAATALGSETVAMGNFSTAMGRGAAATGIVATAMGGLTRAGGSYSTAMGALTRASGQYATAMGSLTEASGLASTAMGYSTDASGSYSLAAGNRARAMHSGAFVWADSSGLDVASTNSDSVTIRASGGMRIFSSGGATTGAFLAPGSGGWSAISDRKAKENLELVDAQNVLDKVAALPLSTWNYKSQSRGVRHIGPMAQDFKAAFGVGESETAINTVDADGVALAAIQGLNRKMDVQLKEKDARISQLEERLTELEALVLSLTVDAETSTK